MRLTLIPVAAWATILVTIGIGHAAPDKEAATFYSAGNKAFEEGDFPKAIEALKASISLKPTVKAYLTLANAYLRLGQLDDARAAFEKVLEIDPKSSKRKVVEQNIKDLSTLARTKLAITSTPPGATVFIDLKAEGPRGKTPVTMPVIPGRHRVMLELDGYESYAVEVAAIEGQDVPVVGALKVSGCDATLTSTPPAWVRIDNTESLQTPATARLKIGEHKLEFSSAGHLSKTRTVLCGADKAPLTVAETLEKNPTATLIVRAEGALRVDGRQVSSGERVTVAPGKHEVEVTAPQKAKWLAAVQLSTGQEVEISPQLIEAEPLKPSSIAVFADAPVEEVAIDGRVVPAGQVAEQSPGVHTVEVYARGHEPFRGRVDLERGEARRVDAHLERRGGTAIVAGLVSTGLAIGAGALTLAAHFSAEREVTGTPDYETWRNLELAGYGLTGGFGVIAIGAFIAGAVQRNGSSGRPERPRVTLVPTANGAMVAGQF